MSGFHERSFCLIDWAKSINALQISNTYFTQGLPSNQISFEERSKIDTFYCLWLFGRIKSACRDSLVEMNPSSHPRELGKNSASPPHPTLPYQLHMTCGPTKDWPVKRRDPFSRSFPTTSFFKNANSSIKSSTCSSCKTFPVMTSMEWKRQLSSISSSVLFARYTHEIIRESVGQLTLIWFKKK